jgi:hypothetical protein
MQLVLAQGREVSAPIVPGSVEVLIRQKVFRAPRTAFDEIRTTFGKLKIMLADISQSPFAAKIASGLVRRSNRECACLAVERVKGFTGSGVVRDRNV